MTITPCRCSPAGPVSLTVDGLNNGGNQIHGVAPGTADTDAVNVKSIESIYYWFYKKLLTRVGTETQRVGAHATMAALKPIQYDPLEPTQIMAGIGNYHRGWNCRAIGYVLITEPEDTMFNVGVSTWYYHNMVSNVR